MRDLRVRVQVRVCQLGAVVVDDSNCPGGNRLEDMARLRLVLCALGGSLVCLWEEPFIHVTPM